MQTAGRSGEAADLQHAVAFSEREPPKSDRQFAALGVDVVQTVDAGHQFRGSALLFEDERAVEIAGAIARNDTAADEDVAFDPDRPTCIEAAQFGEGRGRRRSFDRRRGSAGVVVATRGEQREHRAAEQAATAYAGVSEEAPKHDFAGYSIRESLRPRK